MSLSAQHPFQKVDRGDIVLIHSDSQAGKEITGNRYAVVLSQIFLTPAQALSLYVPSQIQNEGLVLK